MNRTVRILSLVALAGAVLVAGFGCTALLDFSSCDDNEDCHQYEEEYGLVCNVQEGQCVIANCHVPEDCPGDEYTCEEQRCVHGGHHGSEDGGHSEDGGGHGDEDAGHTDDSGGHGDEDAGGGHGDEDAGHADDDAAAVDGGG